VSRALALADSAPPAYPFPASCTGVTAPKYAFGIAEGWKATKIMGKLTQPRSLVFDTNGNMILLQVSSGVSVNTFGADGCVNSTTPIITNRALNHGLALSPDGKTLYASSSSQVWSWAYDPATMKVSDQKVLVKGMNPGGHNTRTVKIVPQAPNLLLAQVGSNSNWDYQSESPSSGRSIVKVFDISKVPEGGYTYNSQGQVLGYGMRNEIALEFDPAGHVWGAENSGDVSYGFRFMLPRNANQPSIRTSAAPLVAQRRISIRTTPQRNSTTVSPP
jgi:glucose/arabinose dehydrogenase